MYEGYLGVGKGGAGAGDGVAQSGLPHADDVHVALDEVAAVRAAHLYAGLVEAVEFVALVVEGGLG